MAESMWSIQGDDGREVISWRAEADPSDVRVVRADGRVRLVQKRTTMGETDDPGGPLTLYRWTVDDGDPSGWKTAPPAAADPVD